MGKEGRALAAQNTSDERNMEKRTKHWFMAGFVYFAITHLAGQYYFYFTFQYYDKILHATNPLVVVMMLLALNENSKLYLVWLATVGLLGLTEIAEYFFDVLGSPTYRWQGVSSMADGTVLMTPIADTMWDMTLGTSMSLAFVLILWMRRLRRDRQGRV